MPQKFRIKHAETGKRFLAKALLSFLLLLAVTDLQTIAAITPQIALGLDTTATNVSYSFAAYSLSAVAAALLMRKFSSGLGKTKLLPLAAILYAASCAMAAIAPSISFFHAARSLGGIAGGFISALAITALAKVTSYEKRGKNMSIISVSYFLAPMLGVPISAFLTDQYGWRIVFLLTAALIFLTGVLIQIFPLNKSSFRRQQQNSSNFEHLDLSASLRMGIVSAFFVSGSIVGFMTFLGTWLFDSLETDPTEVGFIYALINLGALTGGVLGGFLADRFGKRAVALYPNLMMALCFVLLPLSLWIYAVIGLIIGAAFAAAMRVAPLQALLTELTSPAETASYIAARNVSSQIGIGVSVLICGQLYVIYGLQGVSFACAVLSIGAWMTIRSISEPIAVRQETQEAIVTNPLYD